MRNALIAVVFLVGLGLLGFVLLSLPFWLELLGVALGLLLLGYLDFRHPSATALEIERERDREQ